MKSEWVCGKGAEIDLITAHDSLEEILHSQLDLSLAHFFATPNIAQVIQGIAQRTKLR